MLISFLLIESRPNLNIGVPHICCWLAGLSLQIRRWRYLFWYFVAVWVGSKRGLGRIKALLCYYLWFGSKNTTRAQMSWDNCMMPKKVGGLSFISLENDMRAIISGLFEHFSDLQILLSYCITQLQPSSHSIWGLSSFCLFSPNFFVKVGSKV